MEWGPRIKSLKAEEAATKRPNPRLASRPTLRTDTREYWTHYLTLADTRNYNQAGVQPISISTISDYLDLCGIRRGEPALKFFRIMRAMDNAYMTWLNEKNKSRTQRKEK